MVVLPEIWSIVRLPPAVSELTFLPDVSSLKLPLELLGGSPAIKLPAVGTQLGVNGSEPWSLLVVTVKEAEAEMTQIEVRTNAARKATLRWYEGAAFTASYFWLSTEVLFLATAAMLEVSNVKTSFPASFGSN